MNRKRKKYWYIPETPGGSVLTHLKDKTEQGAWDKLLKDAAHMPYVGRKGFEERGYKVERWQEK